MKNLKHKKQCIFMLLMVISVISLSACIHTDRVIEDNVDINNDVTKGEEDEIPATTTYDKDYKAAKDILDSLSIEDKVGQMFIVRYPSDEEAEAVISDYKIGGYIMFSKDFQDKTPEDVAVNIKRCQNSSKVPMMIGVDEEGGTVNRVSYFPQFRSQPFSSPRDIYQASGFDGIDADTEEKCNLLKSLGINLNFAPVCDISVNPGDFMYDRSFGGTTEDTSEYVRRVVTRMKENNVGSVLKHFPGYGDNSDTHTGSAYDGRPYSRFETADFLPFKAGIDAGADMVLVSHNVVQCMDPSCPASLSKKVHEILRNELGFKGIIITDDLSMEAITDFAGSEESAVLAIKAGNDMLCCSDFKMQIPAVIKAVKEGEISEDQINESVIKILMCKTRLWGDIDEEH